MTHDESSLGLHPQTRIKSISEWKHTVFVCLYLSLSLTLCLSIFLCVYLWFIKHFHSNKMNHGLLKFEVWLKRNLLITDGKGSILEDTTCRLCHNVQRWKITWVTLQCSFSEKKTNSCFNSDWLPLWRSPEFLKLWQFHIWRPLWIQSFRYLFWTGSLAFRQKLNKIYNLATFL